MRDKAFQFFQFGRAFLLNALFCIFMKLLKNSSHKRSAYDSISNGS